MKINKRRKETCSTEPVQPTVEVEVEETTDGFSFNKNILSSAHINFLFGAGVNGRAFPQLSGFVNTNAKLKEYLKDEFTDNFESNVDILTNSKRTTILKTFKKEFSDFADRVDMEAEAIKNISNLFSQINLILLNSENRTPSAKQVNIYTLNYDEIVEKVLRKNNLLTNVITTSVVDGAVHFFELLGYNYNYKRYIPTYLVSKLHGDKDNLIFPGHQKYDAILGGKYFEIFFKMKSQLSRPNSILIVIGYSGSDSHLNKLLRDCVSSGLTVYWFRYDDWIEIPSEFGDNDIFVIDQKDYANKIDSTKQCLELLKKAWEK